MKLSSEYKEQGLEVPDVLGNGSGLRFKPNGEGVVEVPESLRAYGKLAEKTGLFIEVGKRWGGFGEGSLPKPWRESGPDSQGLSRD